MPWPDGTPAWLKNQWGILSGQVSARASTAQIIESLRPYAEASPQGWGPRGVIQVQQLRSMAAAIRNASDAIDRAGMSGTVLAEHIADASWGRSPIQQSLAPQFLIRALVTSANPEYVAGVAGVPADIEQWVSQVTDALPDTLDEITENVMQKAADTGSPPAPVTAVRRMEILRE